MPKVLQSLKSRKFISFFICLITFIILGIFGKGEGSFPYIVALYTAYVTSNVAQKGIVQKGIDSQGEIGK